MIEMLVKPKRAERRPYEMFFIGMFYSFVALFLVSFMFGRDAVLRDASGMLIVTFTVICCLPFMYYIIKLEEGKDIEITDSGRLVKEHSKAVYALMYLFMGFVVMFSLWYILFPDIASQNFNFQIKTFCQINNPTSYEDCVTSYGVSIGTGSITNTGALLRIFANNINVLIFTIVFSLALGAGAIFILVWNASVIAAAIGIFSQGNIGGVATGLFRYMIHGIPEIAAYFVGALAGGIVSVAIIRRDLHGEQKWRIFQDALIMIIIAIMILVLAALMEVYLTPLFF